MAKRAALRPVLWCASVCASFAIGLTSCASPKEGSSIPAPATVVVVTPAAPTSVPVPTPPLPPTPALIPTPAATVGAESTVSVPTAAAAIAAIEVRNQLQDPGIATPSEIQFELAEPIGAPEALRELMVGLQALAGVVAVKSDGVHVLVQYDDSHVQPMQLREQLAALGHAAIPGTDAPAPGRAAD